MKYNKYHYQYIQSMVEMCMDNISYQFDQHNSLKNIMEHNYILLNMASQDHYNQYIKYQILYNYHKAKYIIDKYYLRLFQISLVNNQIYTQFQFHNLKIFLKHMFCTNLSQDQSKFGMSHHNLYKHYLLKNMFQLDINYHKNKQFHPRNKHILRLKNNHTSKLVQYNH